MAGLHIGEPEVLTKLAWPAAVNGRTWLSLVQGLHGDVKRKRQEVCVAVDGNSVNIYEIRKGQNIASFAIPDDATFQCAPASIRSSLDSGHHLRQTYCVISRRNISEIQLFQKQKDQTPVISPMPKVALEANQSTLVEIVPLPALSAVIAIREDGSYECFTPELSRRISKAVLDCGSENVHIVAITFTSPTEASKTVLKGRPDIVSACSHRSIIACAVVRSSSATHEGHYTLNYHVWSLSVTSLGSIDSTLHFSHPLSSSDTFTLRNHDPASFISKNTKLVLQSSSKVIKFDTTAIVPRRLSEFILPSSDQISSIELGDNMLLCSSASAIQLYNSSFRSLQASIDLSRTGIKRKRDSSSSGPISLVAYFPSLGRAIGTRRNFLIAVDVHFPLGSNATNEFHQSSLLVNNIGRGTSTISRHKSHVSNRQISLGEIAIQSDDSENWNASVKTLDQYAIENDGVAFEATLFQHLKDAGQHNLKPQSPVPDHKINYVLSKTFELPQANDNSSTGVQVPLKIRLYRPELFAWLTEHGWLDPFRISEALALPHTPGRATLLSHIDVVHALINADPSLSPLLQHISLNPFFSVTTLCQIARLMVEMALANIQSNNRAMNSPSRVGDPSHVLVRVTEHNPQIDEVQLDALLSSVLVKIAKKSSLDISTALRSIFKRRHLVALIQFLRQKLFHAGYTRSLSNPNSFNPTATIEDPSGEHATFSASQANMSLQAIITILSGSIDAVGPLGLLNQNTGDDFIEKLIPELSSEVSRASEAIQDAVFLQGILRETLRYAESSKRTTPMPSGPDNSDSPKQKRGTIRTLYSEATADRSDGTGRALPFSLRAEGRIGQHKVRKGDGKLVERSRREMGMLQDRLRGPYSLERLVL